MYDMVTGTSSALVSHVHKQDVEAAFVAEPFNAEGLETRTVFVEELVLITPKSFGPVRSPKDHVNRSVTAVTTGCSYRRSVVDCHWAIRRLQDRTHDFQ